MRCMLIAIAVVVSTTAHADHVWTGRQTRPIVDAEVHQVIRDGATRVLTGTNAHLVVARKLAALDVRRQPLEVARAFAALDADTSTARSRSRTYSRWTRNRTSSSTLASGATPNRAT